MTRVLMIIAPEGFRDEELLVPKEYLEKNGVKVDIASTKKGVCSGMLGGSARADMALSDVNVDDYDAVMFVGGQGTPIIRKEKRAIEIAREAFEKGKVVTAICWAPTILAKAGVLSGKKATVWLGSDDEYGESTHKVIEGFGAKYAGSGVVVDGKVATADGPRNAHEYAKRVLELIQG